MSDDTNIAGMDIVYPLTQPALRFLNDFLADLRADTPTSRSSVATSVRQGPTLCEVLERAGVPGVSAQGDDNASFLAAIGRLPKWLDSAIRDIAAEALEANRVLRFAEVLEPLPEGVDHWSLELFSHDDDRLVVVRLPLRLACQPVR